MLVYCIKLEKTSFFWHASSEGAQVLSISTLKICPWLDVVQTLDPNAHLPGCTGWICAVSDCIDLPNVNAGKMRLPILSTFAYVAMNPPLTVFVSSQIAGFSSCSRKKKNGKRSNNWRISLGTRHRYAISGNSFHELRHIYSSNLKTTNPATPRLSIFSSAAVPYSTQLFLRSARTCTCVPMRFAPYPVISDAMGRHGPNPALDVYVPPKSPRPITDDAAPSISDGMSKCALLSDLQS